MECKLASFFPHPGWIPTLILGLCVQAASSLIWLLSENLNRLLHNKSTKIRAEHRKCTTGFARLVACGSQTRRDPQTLFTTLSRVTTWNHRLASLRLRSKPAAEVGSRRLPLLGGRGRRRTAFIQEWVASFLIELKANGIKKGEKLPRRSESGVLKLRGQEKGNGRVKGPSVLIRKGSLLMSHTTQSQFIGNGYYDSACQHGCVGLLIF